MGAAGRAYPPPPLLRNPLWTVYLWALQAECDGLTACAPLGLDQHHASTALPRVLIPSCVIPELRNAAVGHASMQHCTAGDCRLLPGEMESLMLACKLAAASCGCSKQCGAIVVCGVSGAGLC